MEIISRDQAVLVGAKRYFTGAPCKRGHIAEKNVASGMCLECSRLAAIEKHHRKNAETPGWQKADYQKNKGRILAKNAGYHARNRERLNGYRSAWILQRIATDPVFALAFRVKNRIRQAVARRGFSKKSSSERILGCPWSEFAAHIERQFLPGMTWANRALWHIDHIVPLATAVTEDDVLALNHFTNLRPLWKPDNLKKGAKQTHLL